MNCDSFMKWIDILADIPQMGMICWVCVDNRSILCIWVGAFIDIYDIMRIVTKLFHSPIELCIGNWL